jgi:hypothetical protein
VSNQLRERRRPLGRVFGVPQQSLPRSKQVGIGTRIGSNCIPQGAARQLVLPGLLEKLCLPDNQTRAHAGILDLRSGDPEGLQLSGSIAELLLELQPAKTKRLRQDFERLPAPEPLKHRALVPDCLRKRESVARNAHAPSTARLQGKPSFEPPKSLSRIPAVARQGVECANHRKILRACRLSSSEQRLGLIELPGSEER